MRDRTLFIYQNENSVVPNDLIFLPGTQISALDDLEEINQTKGFSIRDNNQSSGKVTYLFCKNKASKLQWIHSIKNQACNTSFESHYKFGKTLGLGKFSTVYECIEH